MFVNNNLPNKNTFLRFVFLQTCASKHFSKLIIIHLLWHRANIALLELFLTAKTIFMLCQCTHSADDASPKTKCVSTHIAMHCVLCVCGCLAQKTKGVWSTTIGSGTQSRTRRSHTTHSYSPTNLS